MEEESTSEPCQTMELCTYGHCFLCLKQVGNDSGFSENINNSRVIVKQEPVEEPEEGEVFVYRSPSCFQSDPGSVHSLQIVSKYLEINMMDLVRQFIVLPKLVDGMEMTEMDYIATLCSECALNFERLSKEIQELYEIKQRIKQGLETVSKGISKGKGNPQVFQQYLQHKPDDVTSLIMSEFTDKLRDEISNRCSQRDSTSSHVSPSPADNPEQFQNPSEPKSPVRETTPPPQPSTSSKAMQTATTNKSAELVKDLESLLEGIVNSGQSSPSSEPATSEPDIIIPLQETADTPEPAAVPRPSTPPPCPTPVATPEPEQAPASFRRGADRSSKLKAMSFIYNFADNEAAFYTKVKKEVKPKPVTNNGEVSSPGGTESHSSSSPPSSHSPPSAPATPVEQPTTSTPLNSDAHESAAITPKSILKKRTPQPSQPATSTSSKASSRGSIVENFIVDRARGTYQCRFPSCGGLVLRKTYAYNHFQMVHSNKPPPAPPVQLEPKPIKVLKSHLNFDFYVFDQQRFKCAYPSCNSQFKNRGSTLKHYKFVHLGKGFQCDICNKQFPQPYLLRKHKITCQKLHPRRKPILSSKKSKSSPAKKQVRFTLKQRRSNASMYCDFNKKTKQFCCMGEACGRKFKSYKSARVHYRAAHLGIRFACEDCDKIFRNIRDKRRHRQGPCTRQLRSLRSTVENGSEDDKNNVQEMCIAAEQSEN